MFNTIKIQITKVLALVTLVVLHAAGLSPALGQCEFAKLLASDGAAEDWLGAVAISGNAAVIAATKDDDNGEDSGSAYVFRSYGSGWIQEAKLLPDDGAAGDAFGRSVAVSGDIIVIGASHDDDNGEDAGSAYVFRFDGSTWVQEAKLLASTGGPNDWFGWCVAISDETAVIGAPECNTGYSGSAYVFRFDGSSWVQEARLLASDGATGDSFGISVANLGGTAVIGAAQDEDNGEGSGSAYVFRFDGTNWVEDAKLTASDGAVDDQLGGSVAISGDAVAVGAEGTDDYGEHSGSVYVFRYDGLNWTQEVKLLASDGAEQDCFGTCVAISTDALVVGAYQDDDNGDASGSAYLFHYDGTNWGQEAKLLASGGAQYDRFGGSVALWADTAVIGADEFMGAGPGSAYVFDLVGPDCNGNGLCDIRDITAFAPRNITQVIDPNDHPDYRAFGWADWSPAGDRLVLEGLAERSDPGPMFDLLTCDLNGQDVQVILTDPVPTNGWSYGIPRYSHDGQWIAMHAWDQALTDEWGLGICRADGSEFQWWNPPGPVWGCLSADWSPDDSQILVPSNACGGPNYLYFFDVATQQLIPGPPGHFAAFGPQQPDWRIARYGGYPGMMHVIDVAGNVLDHLRVRGRWPNWSPNDELIAYSWGGRLWVVRPDGSGWSYLGVLGYAPRWSPDSQSLVYHIEHAPLVTSVWRLDVVETGNTSEDCNRNWTPDECDIADGTSQDINNNGVPDECECLGDLDGDWDIDLSDLAQLLAHYGTTSGATYQDGDLDGDADVDLADLAALLAVYGTTCE